MPPSNLPRSKPSIRPSRFRAPKVAEAAWSFVVDEEDFSPAPNVLWVRKRDGRIEGFDLGKLVGGIYAAQTTCQPKHAGFVARELAQAVLFFLDRASPRQPLATAEIAQT